MFLLELLEVLVIALLVASLVRYSAGVLSQTLQWGGGQSTRWGPLPAGCCAGPCSRLVARKCNRSLLFQLELDRLGWSKEL